jgi:type VI protein secretion system component VasK
MARQRDNLIAACVLGAVVGAVVLLRHSGTFDSFFGWPSGSVWPNFVQAAIWVGGAGFCGWYLREHVGRGLAGWFNRHHEAHARKRLDDHHERLTGHLDEELGRLNLQLAEIRSAVRSLHKRLDG